MRFFVDNNSGNLYNELIYRGVFCAARTIKLCAGRYKGEMMKSVSVSVCKVILPVILLVLVFMPCGCSFSQPGETTAEGHRRHLRMARINQQEMMQDTDKTLLLDEPSKLTDKRIP
jgi:hypothetical protein